MPRTTLDIDGPLLDEVRALQRTEGGSMGGIVSRLLAEALARRRTPAGPAQLPWISKPMGALIDLADKEALYAALDLPAPIRE